MKSFYLIPLIVLNVLSAHAQWTSYTPPFDDTIGIADIHVVNENVIWAVGFRYGVDDSLYYSAIGNTTYYAVTADGGDTWKTGTVPMGNTPFVANMTATDAGTALIIGLENFGNAKTLKTTDGGTSWQITPNNWDSVVSWPDYIHAFSPAKMCVIGDPRDGEFEIYITSNAGAVWQKVLGGNIPDPISGEFGYNNFGAAIGNTIWFGTNQGRIYRSQNSGGNWEVLTTPLGTAFASLAFSDENNALAMTGYGLTPVAQIYRTTDGGDNWTELTNLPYAGQYLAFGTASYIPNEPYIIQGLTPGGNLSGPYETWLSADRGDTWIQISTGENAGWPTFINGSVGWAGEFQQLSHKTQLFKYTGSPLVGLLTPEQLQIDMTLSPNPVIDLLHVNVGNAAPGIYRILINDASGKLVRQLEIKQLSDYQSDIPAGDLPDGVYHLTLCSENGHLTKSFLKQ